MHKRIDPDYQKVIAAAGQVSKHNIYVHGSRLNGISISGWAYLYLWQFSKAEVCMCMLNLGYEPSMAFPCADYKTT